MGNNLGNLGWMLASTALLLPLAWWLMRGARGARGTGAGPLASLRRASRRVVRELEVREQVAVGPRERIALVRAGERLLVIGVTAQSMTLLHAGDAREAPAPAAAGGISTTTRAWTA